MMNVLNATRLVLLIAAWTSAGATPALAQEPRSEEAAPPPPAEVPGTTPAPAAAPTPPAAHPGHELFVRAAEAVKNTRALTFHYRSYSKGGMLERVTGKTEADLRMMRASGGVINGWRVRTTGTTTPATGDPSSFDVAWLQTSVEWADEAAKKVMERPVLEARRARPVSQAQLARIDDFTNPKPFTKELAASEYTVEETQDVAGVRCEVVLAKVNNGRLRVRWWLGVDDHLPRRRESIVEGSEGASSAFVELSALRADPSPDIFGDGSELRVPVAEGWTEDRPAAASTPAPPAVTPGGERPTGEAPTPETAVSAAPAPSGPVLAAEFELTAADGRRVSLSSLRGNVVALEFAGTWTLGLREARTKFNDYAARYKDKPLRAYSLAVRERSRDAAIDEHKRGGYAFGLLLDADKAARALGGASFPAYMLIGPEGEVLLASTPYAGGAGIDALTDATNAALAKMPESPK